MTLTLDRLSRRFTNFAALDDVSLEMAPGEFLALLGPSGSGKTTLLRILAGLDYPDRGSVTQAGRDFLAASARERNVGLVFQHYALFRHLTVRENVAFGLRVRPRRRRPARAQIREQVERLLKRVQLEELGDRYPSQLSGGQQQRIAIVRALCMNPQVMLFDEVTAALDPEMVQEVLEVIRDLAGSGMTLLIVTHELAFAQAVADRIVFMDGGHILEQAAPHQFFDNPRSQRARQFLAKFSYTTVSKRKESA